MEGLSDRSECIRPYSDVILKESGWVMKDKVVDEASEEKKLELRLGPPGGDWLSKQTVSCGREEAKSLLSLGYSPKLTSAGAKRGFTDTGLDGVNNQGNTSHKVSPSVAALHSPWSCPKELLRKPSYLQYEALPSSGKPCTEEDETNACTLTPCATRAVVSNHAQTRTVSAPVVGWPPIRSFRKNLANSSMKPNLDAQKALSKTNETEPGTTCRKGLFIKINMEGVPIGRKVDLKAYDSYEKLACAVDELFRGLLAAQRDSTSATSQNKADENLAITGILDGTGEYTLVYEDDEGDRMLAGDVPWDMFVTTVKRLRVLKTSELSMLCRNRKAEKLGLSCGAT